MLFYETNLYISVSTRCSWPLNLGQKVCRESQPIGKIIRVLGSVAGSGAHAPLRYIYVYIKTASGIMMIMAMFMIMVCVYIMSTLLMISKDIIIIIIATGITIAIVNVTIPRIQITKHNIALRIKHVMVKTNHEFMSE